MAVAANRLEIRAHPAILYRGPGFLAGLAPESESPGAPDGRARIVNEPARVRISVYDRANMKLVNATVSKADGTWRIDHLDPAVNYVVIGFDDRALVNAAIQDWVKPHVPEP